MKEIKLSNGQIAKVSDEDFESLSKHTWRVDRYGYATRAIRIGKKIKSELMARRVMGMTEGDGMQVDHINGDKLDNRKENLRVCTQLQNMLNRPGKSFTGLKGVTKLKSKWQSQIKLNKKTYYLGVFDTAEEAHLAYCEAAKRLHGDFANTGCKGAS